MSGASSEDYSISNASFQSSNLSSDGKFQLHDDKNSSSIKVLNKNTDPEDNILNSQDTSNPDLITEDLPKMNTNPFQDINNQCSFENITKQDNSKDESNQKIKNGLEERMPKNELNVEKHAAEAEVISEDNSIYDSDYLIGNSLNRQLDRMAFIFKDKATISEEVQLDHQPSSSNSSSCKLNLV